MKKRNAAILVLVLLLLFSLCAVGVSIARKGAGMRPGTAGEDFRSLCIAGNGLEALAASRTRAGETLVTAVYFNGQALLEDAAAETFYYSIAEDDRLGRAPLVYVEGVYDDIKIAFLCDDDAITGERIESGRPIAMIAYDDLWYHVYSLVPTTLPLLCAETAEGNMTLYDNRAGADRRLITLPSVCRVRGGTTRDYPKKSYQLVLTNNGGHKRPASLLGMRESSTWHLYAAYNDQEKVRNAFCSRLWRDGCGSDNAFGLDNGTEYRYVELFLDGHYWGLYALGYPVDENAVLLKTTGEYLYKKIAWDFEYDADFSASGPLAGYELKDGDAMNTDAAWAPLRDYYRVMKETDEAPTADLSALYDRIDVNNAVDIYLFFYLIQGTDNVKPMALKNVYLTAKRDASGTRFLYTPWDMDISFGNDWGYDQKNYTYQAIYNYDYRTVMDLSPVGVFLRKNDKEISERLKNRYEELRSGAWSDDNVNRMLDEYEWQIFASGAYRREQERWPNGNYIENPLSGLSFIRAQVIDRLHYMDKLTSFR